jgi:hypothetical protein
MPVETKGEAYLNMCRGLFKEADGAGKGELGAAQATSTYSNYVHIW